MDPNFDNAINWRDLFKANMMPNYLLSQMRNVLELLSTPRESFWLYISHLIDKVSQTTERPILCYILELKTEIISDILSKLAKYQPSYKLVLIANASHSSHQDFVWDTMKIQEKVSELGQNLIVAYNLLSPNNDHSFLNFVALIGSHLNYRIYARYSPHSKYIYFESSPQTDNYLEAIMNYLRSHSLEQTKCLLLNIDTFTILDY